MSCTITIRATYKLDSNKRQYMFSKKNEKQNNKNICLNIQQIAIKLQKCYSCMVGFDYV